jgi:hypothetical protein
MALFCDLLILSCPVLCSSLTNVMTLQIISRFKFCLCLAHQPLALSFTLSLSLSLSARSLSNAHSSLTFAALKFITHPLLAFHHTHSTAQTGFLSHTHLRSLTPWHCFVNLTLFRQSVLMESQELHAEPSLLLDHNSIPGLKLFLCLAAVSVSLALVLFLQLPPRHIEQLFRQCTTLFRHAEFMFRHAG